MTSPSLEAEAMPLGIIKRDMSAKPTHADLGNEAIVVWNQTGMTPRQLADRVKELECGALKLTHEYLDRSNEASARRAELLAANKDLLGLVRRAQERLCTYLHPDSGIDDTQIANEMLEMFDGPEQRRVEGIARAANAKATGGA